MASAEPPPPPPDQSGPTRRLACRRPPVEALSGRREHVQRKRNGWMMAQRTNELPHQGVFEQTRALLLRARRHQAVLQICNLLLAPERVEGEVGILEHTCWRREEGIGATRVEIDPYLEEGTIRFEREGARIWAMEQRWEGVAEGSESGAAGGMWPVGEVGHTEPVAAQINDELRRASGQDTRARMWVAAVNSKGGHERGEQEGRRGEAVFHLRHYGRRLPPGFQRDASIHVVPSWDPASPRAWPRKAAFGVQTRTRPADLRTPRASA